MLVAAAILMILVAFGLPLVVRADDIPPEEAVSPTQHLEDRRAAIYENLRDLQGEFQMGKMSAADYAESKSALQHELAGVMDSIDKAGRDAGA